jgi:hypothetical protein
VFVPFIRALKFECQLRDCCEHGNEHWNSIKIGKFYDWKKCFITKKATALERERERERESEREREKGGRKYLTERHCQLV